MDQQESAHWSVAVLQEGKRTKGSMKQGRADLHDEDFLVAWRGLGQLQRNLRHAVSG